jgi:phosphatidylserine/phosphatidylglycerophosphate/cardiolipin synthase-like enzyme
VSDPARAEDWFLSAVERGNPATEIDRRQGDGCAWTTGNCVSVLIDGQTYFRALFEELRTVRAGDWISLTDLQSDGDERLAGPGTEIGTLLADAAQRGVAVRGLLWRSHPLGHAAAEVTNVAFSRTVNDAGGELVLDHRVRRGGSHHQKMVVIQREAAGSAAGDVAFVGGIDVAHGRGDSSDHVGDDQPTNLGDDRYGAKAPWHDVQLRIQGPAVADVAWTFRERWLDPNPLDVPTPTRALRHALSKKPERRGDLAPASRVPEPLSDGTQAVQVLRTYPARRRPYPFAPRGERSIARAYIKAFGRARSFVYIEDQYLWSLDAARALCAALRSNPDLRCVIVIPRYPDPGGMLGEASRFGRWRVERALAHAGGERVAIFDLENAEGIPIYVHAKVCVVDDTWMTVGSDNLNLRSWTHDSEICCAVMDTEGGLARDTRVRLAREHLGDRAGALDLDDRDAWVQALTAGAVRLDAWHAGGEQGLRPPGHLRVHPRDHVSRGWRPLLHVLHARLLDPDGRPRGLRRAGRY